MRQWDYLERWDEQMLRARADGDFQGALEALVRGYQHVIVGYCVHMLGDQSQGEEVAQEVFLAAYRTLPSFRQEASVRTWVFAIARMQCWKHVGRKARRQRIDETKRGDILEGLQPDPPDSPEDARLKREEEARQKTRLEQSLKKLRKHDRDLLMMRYYQELSLEDLAKRFWVGPTTVRKRLQKAEEQLKQLLGLVDHDT